jgi:hypothetical protein
MIFIQNMGTSEFSQGNFWMLEKARKLGNDFFNLEWNFFLLRIPSSRLMSSEKCKKWG